MLTYKDYSLRKRYFSMAKTKITSPAAKKQALQDDLEKTKLQCLEIDTMEPLSQIDW